MTAGEERGRLFGIAYRMLGSVGDAEDVVQTAYLRRTEHRRDAIDNEAAWLTAVTVRLAIDRARQRKRDRERYVGMWLPEPLIGDPADESAVADDLTIGFLRVLERLRPEERSALLLHDVFDYPHAEIAAMLGKSEDAVRQLAARARRRVRDERPRIAVDPRKAAEVAERFVTALRAGDLDGLRAVLAIDVVEIADGGGVVNAGTRPVVGIERALRLLTGLWAKYWSRLRTELLGVNGLTGLGLYQGSQLVGVLSFDVVDERIAAIYVVVNPEKLRAGAPVGKE